MEQIGIIHPGEMGVSLAAALIGNGHRALWSSEARSQRTTARAQAHGLTDVVTLAALCRQCSLLVSVCPPHAAEEVAQAVLRQGYGGMYLDANAISPRRSRRMAQEMSAAGVMYVDGGIIGGPAWTPAETSLYLSGEAAGMVAGLFAQGPLTARVLEGGVGQASGLKMAYAAYTKGRTALLAGVVALAAHYDLLPELEGEWSSWGDFAQETRHRLRHVTAKAWRFEGEMREIADTFEDAGLPGEFHRAAAEVYRRLAPFKGEAEAPSFERLVMAVSDG